MDRQEFSQKSVRVFAEIPSNPLHLTMGDIYGKAAKWPYSLCFVLTALYLEDVFSILFLFFALNATWGGYGVTPK